MQRSYKRWQQGEHFEKARSVMKHFFPSGQSSTGLNRRAKLETVPLITAVQKAISAKKSDDDPRSVMLAVKCNLPKEQYPAAIPSSL